MKFKFIDKLLLVLVLLFLIALSGLCLGTAMDLISSETIMGCVTIITNGLIANRLIIGAVGLVLLIFALRLFVAMGRKGTAPQEKTPSSTLISAGENGTAYITLSAIDSLVQRHCRSNQRIKGCESKVIAMPNGISVSLKLQVLPDTVIPELSAQLQKSLKEYLENLSGITVTGIDILILPTVQPQAPKTK